MQTLILYCLLITFTLILSIKEYFAKIDELSRSDCEVVKLQAEQNNLISAMSQQRDKIHDLAEKSTTTNIYFYVFVGTCAIVVLGICYVYFSSAPAETVSEGIAKNLPEIVKVSTNATIEALEETTVSLVNKLHSVDLNIESLSLSTTEIAIKCIEIDSKVNALKKLLKIMCNDRML